MAGLHAWGKEARERRIVEKRRDERALLMEKAEAVEHHGLDRMAGGHNPHGRVWLGGAIHACRDAEFCKHACDQPQVISALGAVRLRRGRDVRAVRVSQSLLLYRGMVSAPKNYSMTRERCGMADILAYSTPKLPPIPGEPCHRFHGKAATCSTRTLPL